MENRGRELSRNESERGSMSNEGDNTSGSDRTHSPTRHPARRAGLRFTGIDPDTWGQDAQNREVRPSQSESLSHQMRDLSFDRQLVRGPDWDNSLPQEFQAEQYKQLLTSERFRLVDETQDLPFDQQRAKHQAWIDSLPQEFQAQQNQLVLDTERERLLNETRNIPFDQQQARHQAW